jgi:hypothetical protein
VEDGGQKYLYTTRMTVYSSIEYALQPLSGLVVHDYAFDIFFFFINPVWLCEHPILQKTISEEAVK